MRDQWKQLGDEVAPWFQLPSGDEVGDRARSVAEMRKQLRLVAPAGALAGASSIAAEPSAAKPAARRSAKR